MGRLLTKYTALTADKLLLRTNIDQGEYPTLSFYIKTSRENTRNKAQ